MNTASLKSLQEALNIVLFNNWSTNQSRRANHIISLCNYYQTENTDAEVINELKKLSDNLLDYELLEKLTNNLNNITSKDFRWEPRFFHEEMQKNISLSPTFNVASIDVADIVSAMENIRNAINSRSVDLNILISFISKRAKETGDLKKEITEENNDRF